MSAEARERQREAARIRMLGNKHARRVHATAEEAKAAALKRAQEKYKKNPEYFREVQRRWSEKNRARKKEISDAYLERNREKLNAKRREKNKRPEHKAWMQEYQRQHREKNPDLYLTYTHNRRAARLSAKGTHTKEQWLDKIAEYRGCCAYCGMTGKMTRDHYIPLSRGGSNSIDNIVPACRHCNSSKHDMTGPEFVEQRQRDAARQAHYSDAA